MIQETLKKLKEDWLLVATVVLVGVLAFGLGRLSILYNGESDFEILYPKNAPTSTGITEGEVLGTSADSADLKAPGGGFVASKTGAKYHFPWCPGAQTMKEENKIYFATREEAEARGYSPAGNCKGL